MDFEKCARNGEQFLRELAEKLEYPYEARKTIRILKAVLHTLRDHFEFEESLEFLAQMPMFLKAIYVDGWKVKELKKMRHLNDFLREVFENDGDWAKEDFGDEQKTIHVTKEVFHMLRKYVSQEELEEILEILPKELRLLLNHTHAS